jgi:hypothetical protein
LLKTANQTAKPAHHPLIIVIPVNQTSLLRMDLPSLPDATVHRQHLKDSIMTIRKNYSSLVTQLVKLVIFLQNNVSFAQKDIKYFQAT